MIGRSVILQRKQNRMMSMIHRSSLLLVMMMLTGTVPGHAQNSICPTAAPGDRSNKCASTAFVGAGFTSSAANNAALAALSLPVGSSVTRLGFAIPGDGPPVTYTLSGSPCSINSGAGDGFSQVGATHAGCWIGDIASPLDARIAGIDATGSTDAEPTLAALTSSLPPAGGDVTLQCGTYKLNSTFVTGNGTSSAVSTRYGVHIKGVAGTIYPPYVSGIATVPCVQFTWGGSPGGTMTEVAGPLQSWGFENIFFNCNNVAGTGLQVWSASAGDSRNIAFSQCLNTGYASGSYSSNNFGGKVFNSENNSFNKTQILVADNGFAIGYFLDGAADGTTSTDFNTFIDTSCVMGSTGTHESHCGYFRVSDSNVFYNSHFFGSSTSQSSAVQYDYTTNSVFPGANQFYGFDSKLQGSGSQYTSVGTPDTSARPNGVFGVLEANHASYPTNIPNLNISLPLKAAPDVNMVGQTAGIGATNLFTPYVSGMYRACGYIVTTTAGTGGTYAFGFNWNDGIAQSTSGGSLAATALGSVDQRCFVVHATANNPMQYFVNFAAVTGPLSYSFFMTTERLN